MTRSSRRAIAVALLLALGVQGCASPGKPVTQTLRVETPGCESAACELSNDRGTWQVLRTPGTVTLLTSQAPLKVSCRADEGVQGSAGAPSSVGSPSGAGAVVGGAVGGAAIGAATGAAALSFIPALGVIVVLTGVAVGAASGQAIEAGQQAMHYPELISVPMNCASATVAPRLDGAALGLGIRGLLPAEARAATVGERGAVLVTSVAASGAAAAAGLRSGDLILSADGHELADAADLQARVLALAPSQSLALRVWRDGQVLALLLTRAAAP